MCIYIYTHVYIHIHAYVHIYIYIYIRIHIYIYICIYIYIYIHIYIYTYILVLCIYHDLSIGCYLQFSSDIRLLQGAGCPLMVPVAGFKVRPAGFRRNIPSGNFQRSYWKWPIYSGFTH